MRIENDATGLSVLELFAGAGGMSIGLERAGFVDAGRVEIDRAACQTLRINRPGWTVVEADVRDVSGRDYRGVDLVAGSLPAPPLTALGPRPAPPGSSGLSADLSADLSAEALRIVREAMPATVLLEAVHGLGRDAFAGYRSSIEAGLAELGYLTTWRVLDASDFGVPQFRRRVFLVAVRRSEVRRFGWPRPAQRGPTVGQALLDPMLANRWPGAHQWALRATGIAPKLAASSHMFGTPLGVTGSRRAWSLLGIDPLGIADAAPPADAPATFVPRLTIPMTARLQGFDADWHIAGSKGVAYQQIGNASVPALAEAVGTSLAVFLGAQPLWMRRASSHPSGRALDTPASTARNRPLRSVRTN